MNTKQIFGCEVENVNMSDSPDFVDAFISKAYLHDGRVSRELTDEELEKLNENREFIYEKIAEQI